MSSSSTKADVPPTTSSSSKEDDKVEPNAQNDKVVVAKGWDSERHGHPVLDTLAMGFDRSVRPSEEDVYRIFIGNGCKNVKEISWTLTKNIALIRFGSADDAKDALDKCQNITKDRKILWLQYRRMPANKQNPLRPPGWIPLKSQKLPTLMDIPAYPRSSCLPSLLDHEPLRPAPLMNIPVVGLDRSIPISELAVGAPRVYENASHDPLLPLFSIGGDSNQSIAPFSGWQQQSAPIPSPSHQITIAPIDLAPSFHQRRIDYDHKSTFGDDDDNSRRRRHSPTPRSGARRWSPPPRDGDRGRPRTPKGQIDYRSSNDVREFGGLERNRWSSRSRSASPLDELIGNNEKRSRWTNDDTAENRGRWMNEEEDGRLNKNHQAFANLDSRTAAYCTMIGERLSRMNERQQGLARLKIEEALFSVEFGSEISTNTNGGVSSLFQQSKDGLGYLPAPTSTSSSSLNGPGNFVDVTNRRIAASPRDASSSATNLSLTYDVASSLTSGGVYPTLGGSLTAQDSNATRYGTLGNYGLCRNASSDVNMGAGGNQQQQQSITFQPNGPQQQQQPSTSQISVREWIDLLAKQRSTEVVRY